MQFNFPPDVDYAILKALKIGGNCSAFKINNFLISCGTLKALGQL